MTIIFLQFTAAKEMEICNGVATQTLNRIKNIFQKKFKKKFNCTQYMTIQDNIYIHTSISSQVLSSTKKASHNGVCIEELNKAQQLYHRYISSSLSVFEDQFSLLC